MCVGVCLKESVHGHIMYLMLVIQCCLVFHGIMHAPFHSDFRMKKVNEIISIKGSMTGCHKIGEITK